jgi:hypothetical protein
MELFFIWLVAQIVNLISRLKVGDILLLPSEGSGCSACQIVAEKPYNT